MRKTIEEIIRNYKKWGKRKIDEYNTKIIFIEPLINSLGWNVKDLDVVEREARVFGGGRVDFSLKLEGKPIMYIEAKAIKESLSDEKFIAQAVNYANNDGVLWCLLTNGMDYRLYKSDEKGTISDKLMFKFSLKKIIDNPDNINKIIDRLKLLSKESIKEGRLLEEAKSYFIDSKVKKVIEKLKNNPTRRFINIIRDELNKEYSTREIKDSILRISGVIKKHEKEEKPEILTQFQKKYRKLWTGLIEEFKKRNPGITKRKTGKQTYLTIGCLGIGGIHLEWSLIGGYEKKGSWLGTEIHFEKNDREFNHKITEYFENKKDELEEKIGEKLFFQKEWIKNGTWSRIYSKKNAEVITDEVKEWAVDRMGKFYDVFKPMLEEYLKK